MRFNWIFNLLAVVQLSMLSFENSYVFKESTGLIGIGTNVSERRDESVQVMQST